MTCDKICQATGSPCQEQGCRMWMEYEKDLNCCLVAVDKSPKELTLREVGDRLGMSLVAVWEMEQRALKKLKRLHDKEAF